MNLSSEIIEAIVEYYKDDDMITDLLLWLIHGNKDKLDYACEKELLKMNRCPNCGDRMETMTHLEYHDEVDATEYITELYCPTCDLSNNGDIGHE